MPKRLTVQEYVDGIQRGEKRYIAQGITLIESKRQSDLDLGSVVLQHLLPATGGAIRVGYRLSRGREVDIYRYSRHVFD